MPAFIRITRANGGAALGTPPGAQAYNNTTQSVADNTFTPLALNSEAFDTNGFHDNSTNNSRMTIPAGLGGKYLLTGSAFAVADDETVIGVFYKNGAELRGGYYRHQVATGSPLSKAAAGTTIADLVAGDYVEFAVYQNSGGAINFGHASSAAAQATFSVVRLGGSETTGQGTASRPGPPPRNATSAPTGASSTTGTARAGCPRSFTS